MAMATSDNIHIHESDDEFGSSLIKYKKGSSAGSKGIEYQVGILTVFLLNAFQKLRNWKLSTENETAGKFDDVVLEWDEGAILLQAKHKAKKSRKITLEDLLSTNSRNDDFGLPKYFLAYEGIKDKFKIKNVIICTNASLDEKISKYVSRHKVNSNSILYYGNEKCTFYTFNYNLLSCLIDNVRSYYKNNYQNKGMDETVICEENIKQFLGHFQLYSSYPLKNDMMEVVESILSRMKQVRLLQGQISRIELYTSVMNWFQKKNGVYLTDIYAKAIFLEIHKEIHCRKLEKYDVFFETDLNFEDSNIFFHITVVKGCHLLQEIKVFQTLQKVKKNFLYVNLDDDVGELQQVIEAFKLPFYNTLVVVWPKTYEKSIVNEVCNMSYVLDKYRYKYGDKNENKQIVLIAQSIETLPSEIKQNFSVVEGTATLQDFSKETKTDLLTRNVMFQGKSFVLKNLCGMQEIEWYEKALDADLLERLVRREEIKVGVQLASLGKDIRQFYINRTFQRAATIEESFSEESFCYVNEKVLVISDIAGMGKSTVLTALASLIKRQHPELWVIRINLNEYTRILKEHVKKKKQNITIKELLNSVTETELKNSLENELFSMQEKIILMLDGIDEVSPDYTTLMMGMIVECQKEQNFYKIFLTTRPHLTEELERKLDVKSFKLQPFTDENQSDFFAKYWTHSLNLNEEQAQKCKQYARALLAKLPDWSIYSEDEFSAIPQHLQMLAEIFQESNPIGTFADWQGSQEFVRTDSLQPNLPNDMDLATLYDMFIEKKRQLFLEGQNPSGIPGANQALMKQFEDSLDLHRSLALKIIVGEWNCHLFSGYKSDCTSIDTMKIIYKIGIVQSVGDSWQFVHKTFAEYFVAQSITEELKMFKGNLKLQTFLIEKVLIDDDYNVTRAFLNNFLKQNELPTDIFNSYKSVRSKISLKKWKEFNVIHRIAEEGFVAILRMLFKCINVESFGDKLVEINEVYKILDVENTENISSNVLDILETLVQKGGVNIKNEDGRTPLACALLNNRLNMVKFLVEEKNANFRVKDEGFTIPYLAILCRPDMVPIFFGKMSKEGLNPNDGLAMYAAAYLGDLHTLKKLVGRRANLNCRVDRDETLIFAAVRGRQLETIQYLVSKHVDINHMDNLSDTEFAYLIRHLKWFKDYYNEIFTRRQTALHLAVYRGLLDVVEILVERRAELDIKNEKQETPVYLAAYHGHLDILKFLVDRGAVVHGNNTNNKSVMEAAIEGCHEDIVKYLQGLQRGLDIMAPDKNGDTLLHRAASVGNLDTIKFMMKFDVDVNIEDKEGRTALCVAAFHRKFDVVEYLVKHGADVNARKQKFESLSASSS